MGTHTRPRTPGVRFWARYFNHPSCVLFLLTSFTVFCLILVTFAAVCQHIHGKCLTELWFTKLPTVCLHVISFPKFLLRWMSWSLTALPLRRGESVFFLARAGASGEHPPGCVDLSGHELAAPPSEFLEMLLLCSVLQCTAQVCNLPVVSKWFQQFCLALGKSFSSGAWGQHPVKFSSPLCVSVASGLELLFFFFS